MNVTTGARLGPYEIESRLGAGGMGEVWSAKDTRLGRRVAVKILSVELARDAQFRMRFEREARTISQLTHPHICTLHDVGDDFLVMELLEGETVADRIERGPLPMSDVLRYGVQIAEALGAAHRMGIVHRDLKPGNVMITKGGAKLLDFGLAKSSAPVVDVEGATQHKALTQEGTIIGTFQYMAPEQLEGQDADARTDIFALGTLLYEMATGRRAFEGKTRTSLIAQIVSADPKPLRDLQPLTPPAFEHVVARCLSKDPDDRWQNAHDVAEELRWTGRESAVLSPRPSPRARMIPWVIAVVGILIAVATVAVLLQRKPQRDVRWVDIAGPKDVPLVGLEDRGGSAIAPDGNRIAFVGRDRDGISRLYIRDLSEGNTTPLTGTEGASFPFWSPDSRAVAFFADGKLKRADVGGARPAIIASEVDGRGGTWAADGTIVFAASSTSGLSRIRATGGKPEAVVEMTGDQISLRFPSFLPDGEHFLYYAQGERDRGIHIASTDGRVHRKLADAQAAAVFTNGSIVFALDGALLVQKLELDQLRLQGEPRELASGGAVAKQNPFGTAGLSASANGDVLFPAEFTSRSTLVWRDRTGAVMQSTDMERSYYEPSFDPEEKRIAASSDDPADTLWEVDVQRGRAKRLTFGTITVSTSLWSRDGKSIVISAMSGGKPALLSVPASGGTIEALATPPRVLFPETFSPDGSVLLLNGPSLEGNHFDIWTMNVADRTIAPFLALPMNQVRSQFSPDGRWVSYTSDDTGRAEVFVQMVPLSGARWQVSPAGGDQAAWRGDGKELFYLAPDGKLMSVAVQHEPAVSFADPVVLFQTPLTLVSLTGRRNQYLASRDGQRFLLLESTTTAAHLTLVQNFDRLLEKGN